MYFLARRPSCRHGCCCCCSWHRRRDVEGPLGTQPGLALAGPRRPLPALAGPCQSLPVLASPCQPLPALASPYRVVRVFTATEGRSRRAPNENRPRSRSHPSIPRAEFLVLSHVRVPFTSHSLLELGPRAYPSAEAKLSLLIPNTKSSTTKKEIWTKRRWVACMPPPLPLQYANGPARQSTDWHWRVCTKDRQVCTVPYVCAYLVPWSACSLCSGSPGSPAPVSHVVAPLMSRGTAFLDADEYCNNNDRSVVVVVVVHNARIIVASVITTTNTTKYSQSSSTSKNGQHTTTTSVRR